MNDYFNKKKGSSGGSGGGGFSAPKPPKMDFNMGKGKSALLFFGAAF